MVSIYIPCGFLVRHVYRKLLHFACSWWTFRFENLKKRSLNIKNHYLRILLDEVIEKNKAIKKIKQQLSSLRTILYESVSWLKHKSLYHTINNIANKALTKLTLLLNHKLDQIIEAERITTVILPNPNLTIRILSNRNLNNAELEVSVLDWNVE